MNTFIQQGGIKLIKSDSKDMYNVTKDFYFKEMLLISIHALYPDNKLNHGFR